MSWQVPAQRVCACSCREDALEDPSRLHAARVDVEPEQRAFRMREQVLLLALEHLRGLRRRSCPDRRGWWR